VTDGDRDRVIAAEVVAKAWRDAEYRDRLIADPITVLTEAGIEVPAGATVTVLQNSADIHYVAIPLADRWEEVEEAFFTGLRRILPLPEGVELRIVQNTERDRQMVLPVPPDMGEMSDEDLMAVAGGGVGANINNVVNVNEGANINVGGNINAGINVNAGVDVAVGATIAAAASVAAAAAVVVVVAT